MTMTRTRKLKTMGLLTVLLAGCAPAPTSDGPVSTATPTPAASASPSAIPTATPTPATIAALTGALYDIDGAPVEAASVHLRSLDASVPFEATVGATAGRYLVDKVPQGVNVEIEASKPGWTTRKRVTSFGSKPATVDFGAASPDFQGDGAAYFLSDRPEVTSTAPIYDGVPADLTRLRYVLNLSTPLDAANQQRFTQALRVEALDVDTAQVDPIASSEQNGFPQDLTAVALGRFAVKAGTTFSRATKAAASVAWNAEGTTATLAFDAPLLASRGFEARYLVLLEAGPEAIVDTRGRQLGTNSNGGFTGWPAAGKLVPGVFQAVDPSIGNVPGLAPNTREARWATTHDDARRFRLPRDTQAPRITGVGVTNDGLDTRIAISYDEPLVAYDGSKDGRVGPGTSSTVTNVQGFSFALGQRLNDLATLALNGKSPDELDPRAVDGFGAEGDRRREVRFAAGAIVTSRAGAATGSVYMEIDPDDPRRLLITIIGRKHFFSADDTEIAVRFQGPGDPAGNVMTEDEANSHTYRGAL